ncbi:MAG: hypothetical protein ACD_81C00075G0001 [uncultured bacterium]|nr:MAG: hypothetical protein ACD_81C00075G0001 [uncultured bacterium]
MKLTLFANSSIYVSVTTYFNPHNDYGRQVCDSVGFGLR